MSDDDPSAKDPPGGPPRRSGRVQFDDRGQAIWEWELQTGMFDRNASTQRIKVLTQSAFDLRIEESGPPPTADNPAAPGASSRPASGAKAPPAKAPPAKAPVDRASGNPYDNSGPTPRAGGGSDPYSRGPSTEPDMIEFDPSVYRPKR